MDKSALEVVISWVGYSFNIFFFENRLHNLRTREAIPIQNLFKYPSHFHNLKQENEHTRIFELPLPPPTFTPELTKALLNKPFTTVFQ